MNTTSTAHPPTIAIIGAGITGLVAAHSLQQAGLSVRVFEASSRAGGSISTELSDSWLIERGPNSILDGEPCVPSLIKDLGLEEEMLVANQSAKKRFIVRDARLQALPSSPGSLFSTKLFSVGMRCRIFTELLQRPRKRPSDVSLAQLVGDHFGREAVDYGLNPFVGGVYAGDPELLSSEFSFPALWKAEREKGSLLRGMMAAAKERKARGGKRARIVSFKGGLQTMVDALVSKLPSDCLLLNSPVTALSKTAQGWSLSCAGQRGDESPFFDKVLVALPASALASLSVNGTELANSFARVIHPPVTSLFLGFRRDQIAHPLDGFGALVPAKEQRRILGVLFSSSMFPGRAPLDHVGLTVMVGGMRQPEIAHLGQDELLAHVLPDLQHLLGLSGDPLFVRSSTWAAAIPQYNLGYNEVMDCFSALESSNAGLFFGGNARDGISVPNCIAAGRRLASLVTQC